MDELTKSIVTRGDLAHLALFLWATGATGLLVWTLKELVAANQADLGRRADDLALDARSLHRLGQLDQFTGIDPLLDLALAQALLRQNRRGNTKSQPERQGAGRHQCHYVFHGRGYGGGWLNVG